jgi:hypothetical protein
MTGRCIVLCCLQSSYHAVWHCLAAASKFDRPACGFLMVVNARASHSCCVSNCMPEAHILLPTQIEAPSVPQVASSFHALCDRGAVAAPTPPPLQCQPLHHPPSITATHTLCQWQPGWPLWEWGGPLSVFHHDAALPRASASLAQP